MVNYEQILHSSGFPIVDFEKVNVSLETLKFSVKPLR